MDLVWRPSYDEVSLSSKFSETGFDQMLFFAEQRSKGGSVNLILQDSDKPITGVNVDQVSLVYIRVETYTPKSYDFSW